MSTTEKMSSKTAMTVQQSSLCASQDSSSSNSQESIKLKKEIGLLDAIAIVVGIIVGAGIFVSPKGVLQYSNSVGQALVIWILMGLLSLIGALCYAELGTMIPKSGGSYAYINDVFGPLLAFLYLWVSLFIVLPAGNAVTALTFAEYVLYPIQPYCEPPYAAVKLLAAFVTCGLTVINCYNVKWATKMQNIFTAMKVFSLITIIIAGLYWIGIGHTENFKQPFANTNTQPGYIALAMYSGLFSYSGWNSLNFVTEELKNPYKNLPRALCISLPLVTVIYVLINIAYFAVLTPSEILASHAVAITFGDKLLTPISWIMPVFVACSTFSGLNGGIFAVSRLLYVGARNGQLPKSMSLINIYNLTPVPSLIFSCLITLALLAAEDIYSLINYATCVESMFTATCVFGLLWLRHKMPDVHRPIKVYTVLPVLFFIICIFLVILPCLVSPWDVLVGVIFSVLGIPVYYVCIRWKNKPNWLIKSSVKFNMLCAKLFLGVPEDKND